MFAEFARFSVSEHPPCHKSRLSAGGGLALCKTFTPSSSLSSLTSLSLYLSLSSFSMRKTFIASSSLSSSTACTKNDEKKPPMICLRIDFTELVQNLWEQFHQIGAGLPGLPQPLVGKVKFLREVSRRPNCLSKNF